MKYIFLLIILFALITACKSPSEPEQTNYNGIDGAWIFKYEYGAIDTNVITSYQNRIEINGRNYNGVWAENKFRYEYDNGSLSIGIKSLDTISGVEISKMNNKLHISVFIANRKK